MKQYRKKPIIIEAIQYDIGNFFDLGSELGEGQYQLNVEDHSIEIQTLEGTMKAMPGDYIIRGIKGELYPCKPDIFEASYEAV